jgi:putative oxidoreductase
MSVALWYANHGDVLGNGQKAALFLAGYVVLLLIGPGKVSVDKLIGK